MQEHNLLEKVSHDDFKKFSKEQLAKKGSYKKFYTTALIFTGFLFSAAVGYGFSLFIFERELSYLLQIAIGFIFCFTLLIVIHELLHGLAYKIAGAKKVYYGAILSKFIFYAGVDKEIFDGTKYRFIALLPFVSISITGLLCLLLFPEYFAFTLTLLFLHTLFCGGDFAILNFIHQYDLKQIYTYDSREKRKTYYYLKR